MLIEIIPRRQTLAVDECSINAHRKTLTIGAKAASLYSLHEYKTLRLWHNGRMLFLQLIPNDSGTYKLKFQRNGSGVYFSCYELFKTFDIPSGHYYMSQDKSGLLVIDIGTRLGPLAFSGKRR